MLVSGSAQEELQMFTLQNMASIPAPVAGRPEVSSDLPFVTLIGQPAGLLGAALQQENKYAALEKENGALCIPSVQPAAPLLPMSTCPASASPSEAQISFTVLEAANLQDLELARPMAFCYQGSEYTNHTVTAMNKASSEDVCLKLGGGILGKQELNGSHYSPDSSLEPNSNHKPLVQVQNLTVDSQIVSSTQPPSQPSTSAQGQSEAKNGSSQRREKHNCLERVRRKRIRLSCDELNLLVPFCCAETDKATTLQWTTEYLKYLQGRFGDSLKKEFENLFCDKVRRGNSASSSLSVAHPSKKPRMSEDVCSSS